MHSPKTAAKAVGVEVRASCSLDLSGVQMTRTIGLYNA